ncbi:MAG: 23S rRNA (uracil(1939)-C(5))-methyltransferase RlmD [Clostridia bacterium]|nr:23S rRNA (uracil(1939)-C(5))-methyltransferase RlmD [Clostridia bacterium]
MKNIVEIFDMSYEGAGVGKLEGKVVFVPKTLVGDVVEIKKEKETRSYILGRVLSYQKSSADRIVEKCPYFEKCGGCDLQHCAYEMELRVKKNVVLREFQKIGYNGEVGIVASENRFGYRNKIKLEYVGGKLGFFEMKSRRLVEIERCEIADERINLSIGKISDFLKNNSFEFLKSVYIKVIENSVGICFLFEKNVKNAIKNAKKLEILKEFSVFCAEGVVLESNETKIFHIFGNKKFIYNWNGFECETDISAFNQINDEVAKKLYDYVQVQTKNKRVVNAYSGQGLLTLLIARDAKFVYGIEYQKSAHASAEKLKSQIDEYKIENVCGMVEDCLGEILQKDCIDLIVLDPAREGCDKKVLEEIVTSDIEMVVYVSCNFATQVRDLKSLNDKYEVKSVKIFDMFPCTANMETVAILKRR